MAAMQTTAMVTGMRDELMARHTKHRRRGIGAEIFRA
jgi:hypothetical protein